MQVGRGHFGLAHDAALLIDAEMRLVAKIGLAMLDGETRIRVTLADLTRFVRRAPGGGGGDGGVARRMLLHSSGRIAALDDQPGLVELAVDFGQKLAGQRQPVDGLSKPPNGGMVRRIAIEGNAAKPPERQPVAQTLLRAGTGQTVSLLRKHDFEHHQRRMIRCSDGIAVDHFEYNLKSLPVDNLDISSKNQQVSDFILTIPSASEG